MFCLPNSHITFDGNSSVTFNNNSTASDHLGAMYCQSSFFVSFKGNSKARAHDIYMNIMYSCQK